MNHSMPVLKLKSDKFPQLADKNLLAFVNAVSNEFRKMHKHKQKINLSQSEIAALRSLCAQHSLTIKQADKGGNGRYVK